jgi:hypothetical protein
MLNVLHSDPSEFARGLTAALSHWLRTALMARPRSLEIRVRLQPVAGRPSITFNPGDFPARHPVSFARDVPSAQAVSLAWSVARKGGPDRCPAKCTVFRKRLISCNMRCDGRSTCHPPASAVNLPAEPNRGGVGKGRENERPRLMGADPRRMPPTPDGEDKGVPVLDAQLLSTRLRRVTRLNS